MINATPAFTKGKIKKAIVPLGLALAMLSLSACQGSVTTSPSDSPSSSVSISETPSVSPSGTPSSSSLAGTVINGIPTKKELAQDEKGVFIQTTISPEDPALQYNASIVDPSAIEAYGQEEVLEAQKFIVTHIAEEGLDSIMNGTKINTELSEKWWAANKDKYDPQYSEVLYNSIATNDKSLRPLYRYTGKNTELVYGADVTHVQSRKITPTAIKAGVLDGKMRLGFTVNTETVYNVKNVLTGEKTLNPSNGVFIYTLTKDEATGKWIISGFQNTYTDAVA